jgi:hypothetical protein
MLVPRAVPKLSEDSQHLPVKWLCLPEPVGSLQQFRQVVEAAGDIWMVGPVALLINGQRPAVKRLGSRLVAFNSSARLLRSLATFGWSGP